MATEGYVKFEYFSKGVPPYYNHSSFPELLDDEKITIETPCLEMNYHQYVGMFKKFMMAVGFDEKNIMQAGCSLAFSEMNNEKLMREVAEEYDLIMSEDLPDIIQDKIKQDVEWIEKHKDSWEQRYWALYRRFSKLAHLTDGDLEETAARYRERNNDMMPPWGHSDMEALKYTDEELDAMCDKAASDKEKKENIICDADNPSDKCKEHWNDFWGVDVSNKNMWEQGVMKVITNDPMKAWNGLVPGSMEAREEGCICPVLDNEEMPDDKKWVDVECPIHGRKS